MVANASEMLAVTLQADNDKKREWGESYKLKNDPRVTRIGKILRRTSLDELPRCSMSAGYDELVASADHRG